MTFFLIISIVKPQIWKYRDILVEIIFQDCLFLTNMVQMNGLNLNLTLKYATQIQPES